MKYIEVTSPTIASFNMTRPQSTVTDKGIHPGDINP